MIDVIGQAFWAGMFSATSMPLGTITSRFWRPSGRVIGALTAFGAGALLSATVLDLVANAVDEGHILELVTGSIIGSLFFTTVNHVVNQYGGFLRKSSTAIAHANRQQAKQFEELLSRVSRMEGFKGLPPQDRSRLAQALLISRYKPNEVIYPPGSACESLYILHEGQVQLLDPLKNMQSFATLTPGDSFSRMAFLAGTPHGTSAVAATDCEVAILPKDAFENLLETSPALNQATQHLVQGAEIAQYLQERHHLSLDEVRTWVDKTVTSLKTKAFLPDAISIDNKLPEFLRVARQLKRVELFHYLPNETIEAVGNRLLFRRFPDGDTLFYRDEPGECLYILYSGHVELNNPKDPSRKVTVLNPLDVFGGFSFLTGAAHSATAVAKGAIEVWELRKHDLDELLQQSAEFREAIERIIPQDMINAYLQQRQGFSPEQSMVWVQKAFKNLETGKQLPAASDMLATLKEHGNAPLAIWLGLLIDGIPESLTIGAGVLMAGGVNSTLLAGLFISNFPEALSSSDGMRQQGFSFQRILLLWSSVMLVQGVVAGLGSLLLAGASASFVSLIESIGAGAILTVLAETMLPEAYERRGFMVGLSMLLGFLVIILIMFVG
jgi:CRP-like cAMP-binding protein